MDARRSVDPSDGRGISSATDGMDWRLMGYALAYSPCYGCKRPFAYNPMRVPSIPINGVREPICADCVVRVNPLRVKNGLDPIVPLPGAYDACEEGELP